MKVIAIIAEFNPLHWGHYYVIQKAKKDADIVMVLLSGSFTQRGEPVVVDKFTRANDAIKAGADIVITHPSSSATSHGEEFASGAIEFLLQMPNLYKIYCGGENTSPDLLYKAIEVDVHFTQHKNTFDNFLKKGNSYAMALKKTYEMIDPSLGEIFQSNMLLAFGYAKALYKHQKLSILEIVPRIGREENEDFLSASKIRQLDQKSEIDTLERACFSSTPQYELSGLSENLYLIYRSFFLFHPVDFSQYDGFEEGMDNRILRGFNNSINYGEFLENVSTKRYSKVRIQRLLLHSYLGITKEIIQDIKRNLSSFQVLAFNRKGQEYLKQGKNASTHLFTNFKKIHSFNPIDYQTYLLEAKATDLWSILTKQYCALDFTNKK